MPLLHTTTGSYLDVVFDNNVAYVRYFVMNALVGIVSESVSSDHCVRTDDHAGSYDASVEHDGALLERAVGTDGHVASDRNISVQDHS